MEPKLFFHLKAKLLCFKVTFRGWECFHSIREQILLRPWCSKNFTTFPKNIFRTIQTYFVRFWWIFENLTKFPNFFKGPFAQMCIKYHGYATLSHFFSAKFEHNEMCYRLRTPTSGIESWVSLILGKQKSFSKKVFWKYFPDFWKSIILKFWEFRKSKIPIDF